MKVGDLVRYKYPVARAFQWVPTYTQECALILAVNEAGGTLKVLGADGQIDWYVTSYCEVVSETR